MNSLRLKSWVQVPTDSMCVCVRVCACAHVCNYKFAFIETDIS